MTSSLPSQPSGVSILMPVLSNHKAKNITLLDVKHLTDITDWMIICTGGSNRHIKALTDYVTRTAKQNSIDILCIAGEEEAEWVLIDLVDTMIHIMLESTRSYYDLEKLWGGPASP